VSLLAAAAVIVAGLLLAGGSPHARLRRLTPHRQHARRGRWRAPGVLAPGLVGAVAAAGAVVDGAPGAAIAFALAAPTLPWP